MVITTPTALLLPSSSYQSVTTCKSGMTKRGHFVDFPITFAGHTQISRDQSGPGPGFSSEKGEVYNSFLGQYGFRDPFFLQDSILSAKVKWVIPTNLCLGDSVDG